MKEVIATPLIAAALGASLAIAVTAVQASTTPDKAVQAASPALAGARPVSKPTPGAVTLQRSPSGLWQVVARVNGVPVLFVLDTGSTHVVLSEADARRVGAVGEGISAQVQSIGGPTTARMVVLDSVSLQQRHEHEITALVNVNQAGIGASILGLSFLSRFSSIHIDGDKMSLS